MTWSQYIEALNTVPNPITVQFVRRDNMPISSQRGIDFNIHICQVRTFYPWPSVHDNLLSVYREDTWVVRLASRNSSTIYEAWRSYHSDGGRELRMFISPEVTPQFANRFIECYNRNSDIESAARDVFDLCMSERSLVLVHNKETDEGRPDGFEELGVQRKDTKRVFDEAINNLNQLLK